MLLCKCFDNRLRINFAWINFIVSNFICNCIIFVVSPYGSIIITELSVFENTYEDIFEDAFDYVNTRFGSSLTLICIALGGPNNTYEWQRHGVIISNNSELEFPFITGSDGALYQCTVNNAAGSDYATFNITGTYSSYLCISMCIYYSQVA